MLIRVTVDFFFEAPDDTVDPEKAKLELHNDQPVIVREDRSTISARIAWFDTVDARRHR